MGHISLNVHIYRKPLLANRLDDARRRLCGAATEGVFEYRSLGHPEVMEER